MEKSASNLCHNSNAARRLRRRRRRVRFLWVQLIEPPRVGN